MSATILDLANRIPVAAVPVGKDPVSVAINPDTNVAVVTNQEPGAVAIIPPPNPVPVLDSLSPTTVRAQNPGFILTLSGSKFLKTSTVHFNGRPTPFRFISNSQLQADIPASAITQAGSVLVFVTNPAPEGGSSNSLTFTINNPIPSISTISPTLVATGSGPFTLTVDGSGFMTTSSIFFDGQALTTTFVSPTRLTAPVPASAVATSRAAEVKVTNPAPGGGTSNVATLLINTPPTADAGSNRSAPVGKAVILDGRRSADADFDRITFAWSLLSAPTGSAAVLVNPTSVRPGLTPDVAGSYQIQLIVNDGKTNSVPAAVTVTAFAVNAPPNAAPVARAGKDRNSLTGNLVTLNGSASRDPNGDPLSHRWTFVSTPAASAATLTGAAGADQTARQSDTVPLDGTGSSDPNGDPITYRWLIVSAPSGSQVVLSDPSAARPTFIADVAGSYVFRLGMNDGAGGGVPDTVVVTVMPIASLAVTPANPSMTQGEVQQFSATANFPDTTTKDVTTLVTWTSSDTTIATINAAGLATSLKGGTTQIRAAYGTMTSPPQTLTVIKPLPYDQRLCADEWTDRDGGHDHRVELHHGDPFRQQAVL